MKQDIHPKYDLVTVHCSCGNDFETRSTADSVSVELCSQCHPFYTGKQKLVDTGGRIERFERRFGRRKNAPTAPGLAELGADKDARSAGAASAAAEADAPTETDVDAPADVDAVNDVEASADAEPQTETDADAPADVDASADA